MDCLSDIAHDVPLPVKARKDLIADMDIHEEVDELTEQEYNKYSKGNDEEEET